MVDLKKFIDKRICVAVSGGRDSVALLHYLKTQSKACGFLLSAVHCEHGIRGEESLADMRFVESICKAWNIPLFLFQADCPTRAKVTKRSLETAAREFRYESFSALIERGEADYIATAHHSGDEAETVLFRIARGTLSGVKGMDEESGYLLRPFLAWSRADIDGYIEENGLTYREDSTNADVEFTRNKLRNEVLPLLNETVHGAAENLVRYASLAAEDDALLYEYARDLICETEGGYLIAFSEKKPLFTRACLLAVKGLGLEKDYTSAHLESVFALQKSERGAKVDLPKEIEGVKTETGVLLRIKKETVAVEKPCAKKCTLDGFDGGRYEVILSKTPIESEEKGWKTLRIDGDKLPETAEFRFRKDGDKIERFGGGTKTLKKFFNEKKTPVEEREYIPLIVDGEEVLVVCGCEISEKVKITPETKNVLYVVLKKNGCA